MPTDRLSSTFAALADPTRRAILARLASGETSVTELAEPFDMSLPAVSKHLKVLERAGLIIRGREAQWRPCRISLRARCRRRGGRGSGKNYKSTAREFHLAPRLHAARARGTDDFCRGRAPGRRRHPPTALLMSVGPWPVMRSRLTSNHASTS